MTLIEVELPIDEKPVPRRIADLVADADRRIQRFVDNRPDRPLPGFVPSDYTLVYRALAAIGERRLAAGRAMCEWGCGFGVVAMLAATLDYDACGIEFEPDLVDQAQQLASDHGYRIPLVCGTFVPDGGDHCLDDVEAMTWLLPGGANGYDLLGLEPDDFDLVFAYPWPGEQQVVYDLFHRFAGAGALLLTYHGVDELRLHRKLARRRRGP